MNKHQKAILYAVLAALLYAISSPISKILLTKISPVMMAALLYLGAGLGLSVVGVVQQNFSVHKSVEKPLSKKELPYIFGMIILDILAPILLMLGLSLTSAANASLLNNFEIVATTIIALFFFKEKISFKLWIAIFLVTFSSALLSIEDISSFSFSIGSIFVILACICWGLENNYTRVLSNKNPLQIVVLKGFGSGFGSLMIALVIGELSCNVQYIVFALILGFMAYGLSIFLYVYAQRELGASRTSAYYAFAPFMGTGISLVIFGEVPTVTFIIALSIMLLGAYMAYSDRRR